jgi:hypothetical protein
MARGQAQYLRIYDAAATYARWQGGYPGSTIVHDGATWSWLAFDCESLTDGSGSDEGGTSVDLPATPQVVAEVEGALRAGRLVTIESYEFDTLQPGATVAPIADQTLVASFTGEVVGASGGVTTLTLELGSSLSPVGAQVPPRLLTTRLVGVPAKLFGTT